MRLTKKTATELFKKVFGRIPQMKYWDEPFPGGIWSAELGEMTAECSINEDGKIRLWIYMNDLDLISYYDPETLEADSEYTDQKQRKSLCMELYERLECRDLAVVRKEEAGKYGIKEIWLEEL